MIFRRNTCLAWMACALVAFIAARVGDTHLHLCPDGSAPTAAVHVADTPDHHDHHADAGHDDRDIDVLDLVFAKSAGQSDLLAPLVVAQLVLPRDAEPGAPPSHYVCPATHPPFHLRPPLRGPPA